MTRVIAVGPLGLRVLPADLGEDLGRDVVAFFTTRHGGVSRSPWESLDLGLAVGDHPEDVRENRRRVAVAAGAPVRFATQVHGRTVLDLDDVAERTAPGAAGGVEDSVGEADGLVSGSAGVGVLVADCVPVLLAGRGPEGGVIVGAAHAGRRGLSEGVVAAVVERLRARGASRLHAAVGPAVCGSCYEVPAQLRAEVAAAHPAAWSTTRDRTPALDLPAGVLDQLRSLDVPATRVSVCTLEDPDMFSHRRGAPTGRTAGVIATRRADLRRSTSIDL